MQYALLSCLVTLIIFCLVPRVLSETHLYEFNTGIGSSAVDSIGNDDCTISESSMWKIDSDEKRYLTFDGINDGVSCGNGPSMTGSVPYSISFDIRTTTTGRDYVWSQRDTGTTHGETVIDVNNGIVRFWMYTHLCGANEVLNQELYANTAINDGAWHHILCQRTINNIIEIYIDGVRDAVLSPACSIAKSPINGNIKMFFGYDGRAGSGAHAFHGDIDNIYFSNDYNVTKHEYKFDTGSGITVADSIDANADCSLSSSAMWKPSTSAYEGYELQFDGSTFMHCTTATSFQSAYIPFGVSFDVKLETAGKEMYLVSQRDSNVNGQFIVRVMTSGLVNFFAWTSSTGTCWSLNSVRIIDDLNWHHIMARRTVGDKIEIWIDYTLDTSVSPSKNMISCPLNGAISVYVGVNGKDVVRYFEGRMDNLIFFEGDGMPTPLPSMSPTQPSMSPTSVPSSCPSTSTPSLTPSTVPTVTPTAVPTSVPSQSPSTSTPTGTPTTVPTVAPTTVPTSVPSQSPSTSTPTLTPTTLPTVAPTTVPTTVPSQSPSTSTPTGTPTTRPTLIPTTVPTTVPSKSPTTTPSVTPTMTPSASPTFAPTSAPTPTCPNGFDVSVLPTTVASTGDSINVQWISLSCTSAVIKIFLCAYKSGGIFDCYDSNSGVIAVQTNMLNDGAETVSIVRNPPGGAGIYVMRIMDDLYSDVFGNSEFFHIHTTPTSTPTLSPSHFPTVQPSLTPTVSMNPTTSSGNEIFSSTESEIYSDAQFSAYVTVLAVLQFIALFACYKAHQHHPHKELLTGFNVIMVIMCGLDFWSDCLVCFSFFSNDNNTVYGAVMLIVIVIPTLIELGIVIHIFASKRDRFMEDHMWHDIRNEWYFAVIAVLSCTNLEMLRFFPWKYDVLNTGQPKHFDGFPSPKLVQYVLVHFLEDIPSSVIQILTLSSSDVISRELIFLSIFVSLLYMVFSLATKFMQLCDHNHSHEEKYNASTSVKGGDIMDDGSDKGPSAPEYTVVDAVVIEMPEVVGVNDVPLSSTIPKSQVVDNKYRNVVDDEARI